MKEVCDLDRSAANLQQLRLEAAALLLKHIKGIQVCDNDWNEESGLCVDDAPREAVEVEAARAAKMKKDIEDKAEKTVVFTGDITQRQTACPKCGKPAGTGKFCNNCGAPMGMLVCPKCGAQSPAGTRFCGECGGKL